MSSSRTEIVVIDEKRYGVEWKGDVATKRVVFDNTRCIGCGLCIRACPFQALSLGPLREIVDGSVEAPKIVVDETRCCVCPICSAVCMFNAISFEMQNRSISFPRLRGYIELDTTKCHLCYICSKVCPVDAISIRISIPKKDQLVRYLTNEVWARGSIRIDESKCVFCGLCEALCDAIKIVWRDKKDIRAPDYSFAVAILVDEKKCDYCGLCAEICPYDAIEVECYEHAPRTIEKPRIEGEVQIDTSKCVFCGLCAEKCPAKAIRVVKPIVGRVIVVDKPDCDPLGCKYCQIVCPVNAFYIPRDRREGKIKADERFCIYCGACEAVCPVNAIKVIREDVSIELGTEPWTPAIAERIHSIIEGFEASVRVPRLAIEAKPSEVVEEKRSVWISPPEFARITEKLRGIVGDLSKPSTVRKIFGDVLKG